MRRTCSLLAAAAIVMAIVPSLALANDSERIAFYQACGDPDPGARLRKIGGYLASYPAGERSDRARAMLLGVAASGAWQGTKSAVDRAEAKAIVSREGEAYLAKKENPDRVLLVAEAYLRTGGDASRAADLARRGAVLAENAARPADVPISSWGRIERERTARSNYLAGLAASAAGDEVAAADLLRKAEPVFRSDPRFAEEYARIRGAAGIGQAPAAAPDDRSAALEAIAASLPDDRVAKFEDYLRRFPDGAQRAEIGIRLVEELAKKGNGERATAVADRVAAGNDDPEVLSALALVLADAGVGTDRAVAYGARAVDIVERIVRDPSTEASALPAFHADLQLVRDAYGWALLRSGKPREAALQLELAAQSEYPEVEYHYGAALVESGDSFDAADPLVNAYLGGSEEAWSLLQKVRSGDTALRSHIDGLVERGEENLRRRKIAEEDVRPAPELALVSLDGKVVASADWKGAPVVLYLWATWCDPCRDLLPRVQNVAEAYRGKGVRFFGINTDRDFWLVRPFLEERKLHLETLFTAGEEDWDDKARSLRVGALPTVLVIDGRGDVRYADEGGDPGGRLFEKVLSWRIDRLLEE
jgi:thiol-disulfide isomerase/thioredoxin